MKIEVPKFKFALREDLKNEKQFLPFKTHDTDTGYDVRAAQEDRKPIVLKPYDRIMIPLGFRVFCPPGWWYKINPRSSTFVKKHLHALYGVVDESYENMANFAAQYIPSQKESNEYWVKHSTAITLTINFGDPIAQIIPARREIVDFNEISNEEYNELCKKRGGTRGANGFGSTSDKK